MNYKIKLFETKNNGKESKVLTVTKKQLNSLEKKATKLNLKFGIEVLKETEDVMEYKDLVSIGDFENSL